MIVPGRWVEVRQSLSTVGRSVYVVRTLSKTGLKMANGLLKMFVGARMTLEELAGPVDRQLQVGGAICVA